MACSLFGLDGEVFAHEEVVTLGPIVDGLRVIRSGLAPTDRVIIEGRPRACAREIARSQDGSMSVIAWSCSKGRFRWQYQIDEMLHILSGQVILTDESGTERRVGPVVDAAVDVLLGHREGG